MSRTGYYVDERSVSRSPIKYEPLKEKSDLQSVFDKIKQPDFNTLIQPDLEKKDFTIPQNNEIVKIQDEFIIEEKNELEQLENDDKFPLQTEREK